MLLARFLSKLFAKEGIVLVDSQGQKYICGEILNKEKPLTLKLLNKDLNWKLLIYPELYLGEEYYKGNIKIENGSIYDFLHLTLKNLGRGKINIYSTIINKITTQLTFVPPSSWNRFCIVFQKIPSNGFSHLICRTYIMVSRIEVFIC